MGKHLQSDSYLQISAAAILLALIFSAQTEGKKRGEEQGEVVGPLPQSPTDHEIYELDPEEGAEGSFEVQPQVAPTTATEMEKGEVPLPADGKEVKKTGRRGLAAELQLGRAGFISGILRGKIPPAIQRAAGGKVRPRYLKWPVPGGRFGRGFGSGKEGKHKGLDIVAPMGTPVRAAAAGLVVWAAPRGGYGETIIIVHSGGWVTLYAHLSKYLVKPGMKVAAMQKIGKVGSTGISKGPHLHFMLFDNGVVRDPAPLVHPSIPHPPHLPPMPYTGHTVKKGQTPKKIADQYGVDLEYLLLANGMKEGDELIVGWRIIIPKRIGRKSFTKGYYTVKKGDTLSAVAVLYDVSVKELMAINDVKDEDLIKPGMKLKLPEGVYSGKAMQSGKGEKDGEVAEQGMGEGKDYEIYTLKEGDNLFSLARKYGTTVKKIAMRNGIENPARVKPGTKIRIPLPPGTGKGGASSASAKKREGGGKKKK